MNVFRFFSVLLDLNGVFIYLMVSFEVFRVIGFVEIVLVYVGVECCRCFFGRFERVGCYVWSCLVLEVVFCLYVLSRFLNKFNILLCNVSLMC